MSMIRKDTGHPTYDKVGDNCNLKVDCSIKPTLALYTNGAAKLARFGNNSDFTQPKLRKPDNHPRQILSI
jgi:hypothetical protein